MSTVLFTWELGAGLGHLMPLRALMREVLKRGHRAVGAFRELGKAKSLFLETEHSDGASFQPSALRQAPYLPGEVSKPYFPSSSFPHLLHNTGLGETQRFNRLITEWKTLYSELKPDLVVFDHSPSALIAAQGQRFKTAQFGTGFCCPVPQTPFPSRRPECPFSQKQLQKHEHQVLARLNAHLAKQDLAPLPHLADLLRTSDATWLTTFPELDHGLPLSNAGQQRPESTEYLGPWGASGDSGAKSGVKPVWPEGNGERVFLYSKLHPHLGNVINMLLKTQQPTVAYIADCPAELLSRKFQTLRISPEPIDLKRATQESDVAILNGGHGACAEFLLAGVPLLLLPLVLEQRILSERLARQKLGRCADPSQLMDMVKAWIGVNKDPIYRQRAQQFCEKYTDFEPHDAVKRCADRIDTLLAPSAQQS